MTIPKQTYPDYIRQKARSLRSERNLSIDELVECLQIPRTTIYHWVKDIPLRRKRQSAAQIAGTTAMQQKYAALRQAAYELGLNEAKLLLEVPTFRDFIVLYIAEGYKRDRNCVEITNSDPKIIALSYTYMSRYTARKMHYTIQHHADQDVHQLREFWSSLLNVNSEQMRAVLKSNSGQLAGRKFRCVYGVFSIKIADTYFRSRLQGWIDELKNQW